VERIFYLIATIALIGTFPCLWSMRRKLRFTTLLTSWNWLCLGVLLWAIAWAATCQFSLVSAGRGDLLWYLVSVVMLCPWISVLGARRPGNAAWTWFVTIPLVAVLSWPALVAFINSPERARLQLEEPVLLGFLLAWIMGIGNYLGTRFSFSVLGIGIAVLLVVVPLSVFGSIDPERARIWATLLLCLSIVRLVRRGRIFNSETPGLNRLWFDFRDYFGIVWGKRILDRFNDSTTKGQSPLRLEMDGFQSTEKISDNPSAETDNARLEAEKTMRWLLRRFVDPEWIDARLGTKAAGPVPEIAEE